VAVRLPAHQRRRQLLEVAVGVFAENGYHRTSMDQVAEAAGVTKPVLYQHFGSKRKLYLELLDDVGTQLTEAIAKATATATTPREQVLNGVRCYFDFVVKNRSGFTLLFGSGARRDDEFNDRVRRVENGIAELVAPLIEAGIDDDHRRLLAHGLVGLAEGVGRHWVAGAVDADPYVAARRVAELAWAGLRGVRPDDDQRSANETGDT
jgi:AcrR family transcriptional regulator